MSDISDMNRIDYIVQYKTEDSDTWRLECSSVDFRTMMSRYDKLRNDMLGVEFRLVQCETKWAVILEGENRL